jgi:hypothetical protein
MSSDVVHSGCTGLCVTVELYNLPAWLAGAVNNNNREFVVGGWRVDEVVRMSNLKFSSIELLVEFGF